MKGLQQIADTKAPNEEYLELNFVGETATGRGLNTQFIMENLHDGTFQITDGRVGIKVGRYKPKVYVRPITEWQSTYEGKILRGYLLTKQKKMEAKKIQKSGLSVNGQNFAPLNDTSAERIIERLLNFANHVFEQNFTVKVEDISEEMIAFGKKILDELGNGYENMSVAEFNNKLKILFAAIPRRMDSVSKFIAHEKSDLQDIVATEQDLYDIMISQVKNETIERTGKTILESYGLTWRETTAEEKDQIRKKLGHEGKRFVNAWRIENLKTEKDFNAYCEKENLTEGHGIDHLFHGSRNENFWSIITNGLTINPSGVVITGKAYGNGTYFAPDAHKSMGYTSRCGSKWASGSERSGFMGIYKVATGKRYPGTRGCDSSLNWSKLQQICPGAHCTWAESRYSGFMMDEVIVYQNCQSTIEYLVEVGLN